MLLSVCGLLAPIALLLMVAVPWLTVSVLLLVWILVSLVVLRRCGIGRVAAVRVVALVVLAVRRGVVALLLLVGVVRRRLVCALDMSVSVFLQAILAPESVEVFTCPWGGYGLCDWLCVPPY